MIVTDLRAMTAAGCIAGQCAKCKMTVYESTSVLDDCYNVWMGRCPHCDALNFLGMTGLRGYSSSGMDLVLPTDEEVERNKLPVDTPTRGSHGPADQHGTVLGELAHRLRKGMTLQEESHDD